MLSLEDNGLVDNSKKYDEVNAYINNKNITPEYFLPRIDPPTPQEFFGGVLDLTPAGSMPELYDENLHTYNKSSSKVHEGSKTYMEKGDSIHYPL